MTQSAMDDAPMCNNYRMHSCDTQTLLADLRS